MENVAIIGGGISGISVAYFLDRLATIKGKKINIDIIEKNAKFAQDKIGKFQYEQEIYDSGWHNSISEKGVLFQIMLEIGLYRYLIKSKETYSVLYTKEGIKKLPENMLFGYPLDKGELLQSDIFNFKEKLSILMKLHKKVDLRNLSHLTVEDFFLTTINENVYRKIVEPILTNYYGSDISDQNFSLLMPDLALATIKNSDVESVISEMQKNNVVDNILTGYEYRLKFTLSSFLENLESYYSNRVFIDFNKEVEKIERVGKKYALTINGKKQYYDKVIMSIKHIEFLKLFEEDRRLQRYYKDISFVNNIVLTLICEKDQLQINNEIGEIIYSEELDRYVTSIEYVSNKWLDIKSKNIHMLRVYINRQAKVKELLEKSDNEIEDIIKDEISKIHPNVHWKKCYVTKVENNYIYANKKYSKYIETVGEYLSEAYPDLYFIGNSKKAINLEHTVLEAREIAKILIQEIK